MKETHLNTTEGLTTLYDKVLSYLKEYFDKEAFKPIDRVRLSKELGMKEWEFNRILKYLVIKQYIIKNQTQRGVNYKKLEPFDGLLTSEVLLWIEEYDFELAQISRKAQFESDERRRLSQEEHNQRLQQIKVEKELRGGQYKYGYWLEDKYLWFDSQEDAENAANEEIMNNVSSYFSIVQWVGCVASKPQIVRF